MKEKFNWNKAAAIAGVLTFIGGAIFLLKDKIDLGSGSFLGSEGTGTISSGAANGGSDSSMGIIPQQQPTQQPTQQPQYNIAGLDFLGIAPDNRPVFTPTKKDISRGSTVVNVSDLPQKYWIDTTGGKSVTIASKIQPMKKEFVEGAATRSAPIGSISKERGTRTAAGWTR